MSTGQYIYWKELPAERKWKFIPYTPTEVRKAILAGAAFTTWLRFSHEPGNGTEPVRYGDPVLDFDCKENPERAVTDARRLIGHLSEYYGVDPDALKLSMSGGKGCHVKMPAYLFGAEQGHEHLHLLYKSLAQRWKDSLELSTLDMSLYAGGRGKMFRLPNVRRENGRFKVPVTWNEFNTLSMQDLDALTENPRKIEAVEVDRAASELLVADFEEALSDCTTAPAYEPLSSQEMARMANEEPPCISKILLELPEKNDRVNFNKLVGLVVNFYQGVGASYEEALERSKGFIKYYPHSESYDTEPKRRAEFDKIWKFMLSDFGYFFSCERMKALGLEYDCLHCIKDTLDIETAREASAEAGGRPIEAFPYQVMTGPAGHFAEAYGAIMETPKHFLFMSYLACLGSYFSPDLTADTSANAQTRLIVLLVGGSSIGRKSTTISKAVSTFESVFVDFKSVWGIGSAEGLQKILKVDKRDMFAKDRFGVLLCFDEFKYFVQKCRGDSSVLLPAVNSLFENNNYENHTKNTSFRIRDGFISILAATTRETYERIYDPHFLAIGFPNRVFLVPGEGERRFSIPPQLGPVERKIIHENLIDIKTFVGPGVEIGFDNSARTLYDDWYHNTLDHSVHALRLDTYSLRLMMLLALNAQQRIVDRTIAEHAIALCDWQNEVRKEYDPIDADTAVAAIEQKIMRLLSNKGPMTERDLARHANAYRTGLGQFDFALKNLKRFGHIGVEQNTKRWRLIDG